jgi:hypothetical protein
MIKVAPASASSLRAYEEVISMLEAAGAARGSMFGMPCVKVAGKAFAGRFGDAIVVKLRGAPHEAALQLAGAVLFDPSGAGRPMKEWVVVPSSHRKRWAELAQHALAYVAATPEAKKPKKPTK